MSGSSAADAASRSELVAYTDGGSRGNPGPAGFGVVVQDSAGRTIDTLSEFIGEATNNVAEYRALLAALEYAHSQKASSLKIFCDSELMVQQMNGRYRVQNVGLKPLFLRASELARGLKRFSIQHIPREQNSAADRLANEAMDRKAKAGTTRPEPPKPAPPIFYAVAQGGILKPKPSSPPLVEGAEYEVRFRGPGKAEKRS